MIEFKFKMPKERASQGQRKERKKATERKEGDRKGKGKGKDQKGKGVAACYTCGKSGHLARDCWRDKFDRLQVIQPIFIFRRSVSDYSYSWPTTSQPKSAE